MPFQNPYADRLKEYSSFVFDEPDLSKLHRPEGGGWFSFFRGRMGFEPSRVILEIGCSNASFLCEIALANPQVAFVGMDWKFKVLFKGAKRADQEKIQNIALLRGRAQELDKVFGRAELDEIWLFFPDPWAKKSQLKHRLVREEFLVTAHQLLKPGGRIFFKTDHPGYFQWVLALFGAPQPELPDYAQGAPEQASYKARQIKVRKLESDNLPCPSARAQELFDLTSTSINYWSDSVARATLFGARQNLFEKGFVADGLPIYYAELARR